VLKDRDFSFRGMPLLQIDPVFIARMVEDYLSELAGGAHEWLAEASRLNASLFSEV